MNRTTDTGQNRGIPISVGTIRHGDWDTGRPLPLDGCSVMLCNRGSARLSVNSHEYTMSAGMMSFIIFDMVVIPIETSPDFEARCLDMDFDTTQDISFLVTSQRFWDFIYTTPVFPLSDGLPEAVRHWFSLLQWMERACTPETSAAVMHNEAENFILIMAEQVELRLGLLGVSSQKNRAWSIVNDFTALLNRHYARHHDVAYYADRLNVTPNYLNIIIKRNTGISAKEQIKLQLCLVIKTLLDTTDLSVKEIAERLHYDDPSYLCRIFRKQTGMTPIQYRNKLRTT